MRPNIVVIVFDTARADALEPYGAARGASPAVRDLAGMGWAAERCYATSNWTLPSHLSLFTGMLPRPAGLGPQVPAAWAVRANAERSIGSVFTANGYATAAISANPWISANHGFAEGFDRFVRCRMTRRHAPTGDVRSRWRWVLQAARARIDDGLSEIEEATGAWIDEHRSEGDRPFLWFANLMECHSPYLPPAPYNDLGLWRRLLAARDAAKYQSHEGFVAATLGRLDVPDGAIERMRHLYGRAVLQMDDWLARFLGRLDEAKLLENTLVCVVSDHGENLGECNLFSHMLSLDDRLIRVPLVVGGGVEVGEPSGATGLAAVPRLLAQAAGLASHPWVDDPYPDGVAVAQYDGLASFSPDFASKLAEGMSIPASDVETLSRSGECVTDGRFKLVRTAGVPALYDVEADPLETIDASAAHPDVVRRLSVHLDAVSAIEPRKVERPDGAGPSKQEQDDLEERMRVLGYL